MRRTPLAPILVLALLSAATLGCSLVGRAVDSATGGAASTLEAVQSELQEALATLPSDMDGILPTPPVQLPGLGEGPPALDLGAAITGSLSYPSEAIPPLRVVAFDVLTQEPVASVETAAGQSSYTLPVPNGVYYVVAYTQDGSLAGGYSAAVLCGLSVSCTDHSLIPVPAANGMASDGIDPGDWYAPAGAFPPAP